MANKFIKQIQLPNSIEIYDVCDTTARTSAESANQVAQEAQNIANSKTTNNITVNGRPNNSPSFYAPTNAGTAGYFLKSNGSGTPIWASMSGGLDIQVSANQPTNQKDGDFWYQIVT